MVFKNDPEIELTTEEFNERINNSDRLVVVDFFSDCCMSCLMISPMIEELAEKMERVKFVKIDLDNNQEIANKYGAESPCLAIFKKGEIVDRIFNVQSIENLKERIMDCF